MPCCGKVVLIITKITSTHNGDYYFVNYHYSFTTKNKLKSRENMCKSHDGNAKKGKSILKFNQDKKS